MLDTNCELNKGDKPYSYLESGSVIITVKNKFKKSIHVVNATMYFDYDNKELFSNNCNVKIKPNETDQLLPIEFRIGLMANIATNVFTIKITYNLLNKNKLLQKELRIPGKYLLVAEQPLRNEKIFLSHSNNDNDIVTKITNSLKKLGLIPYVSELDPNPGDNLWEKIRSKIQSCDLFLVLYTKDGSESRDVGEEIGFATGSNKTIIPIVETGISPSGSLSGREYASLDKNKIDSCINNIIDSVLSKIVSNHK